MAFLGSWLLDLSAAVAVIFGLVYFYITSSFDYWKKKNVSYIKPKFPFGNFSKVFIGKATFSQVFDDFYPVFKKQGFGGVYNMRKPTLVVCKPELVKHFLTKDFNSFHDRGLPYDEENDPFSAHLFNLGGTRWRGLRAKLSPTFTSGKIKGMLPLIQECSKELEECIREQIKTDSSIEMKDLLTRFTTDVIGSCAFGINCNSIKNPKGEFYQMSREIFQNSKSFITMLRFFLTSIFPSLAKQFKISLIFSKITTFFTDLMDRTLKYRKDNKVERNDFVQLMMKIMEEEAADGMTFDQKIMTAQAFLFFLAGLDNVSNNVGFCLTSLALDQELQEKVHQEISAVLKKHNGKMSYEALGDLDLVPRVLDEGLRKFTPAGVLVRVQNEDKYIIPDTDIELEKGTEVMFPIQSIHMDEEYFPNPEKFDPDRFTEEEKSKRHPYAYIPFGEGPRFCIAKRFAHLEMQLCFAELLRNFKFEVAPKTDTKMELDLTSLGTTPKNDFWLHVSERNTG